MDLALSEEQKMIVEMVRQFVREEIVPWRSTSILMPTNCHQRTTTAW